MVNDSNKTYKMFTAETVEDVYEQYTTWLNKHIEVKDKFITGNKGHYELHIFYYYDLFPNM